MEGDMVLLFMKEPRWGGAVLNFWQPSDLLKKDTPPPTIGYFHQPEEYKKFSVDF